MGIKLNIRKNITINGKKYRSEEEMPADVRRLYRKALESQAGGQGPGSAEFFATHARGIVKETGPGNQGPRTRVTSSSQIVFNGKEYTSVAEMPAEARKLYEMALEQMQGAGMRPRGLLADEGGGAWGERPPAETPGVLHFPEPVTPSRTSAVVKGALLGALALAAFLLWVYFLSP
ncbi:MAG: hypothetical protein AB1921_10200 [Thermodesulfobacteriota bacterium]